MKKLFTSEAVTEGHPDKLCDRISDAVLDAVLAKDPAGRVACECFATTGLVVVGGEISTDCTLDIQKIARNTICEVGYDSPEAGFDGNTCAVLTCLDEQSPDINMGVTGSMEVKQGRAKNTNSLLGAGDQGMMFGYACNETPDLMPLPITIANELAYKLSLARKDGTIPNILPDGKTQVTVEYGDDGKPKGINTILISTQHTPETSMKDLRQTLMEVVLGPTYEKYEAAGLEVAGLRFLVNPTGRFVKGGPAADAGLTGRKIIADTYGGYARHGGGAFSGKDPTKVDRSAAYMARYIAKNIVAAGLADRCEVQLAYAIGVAHPVSVMVETFGTGITEDQRLADLVNDVFDMQPKAIIEKLKLRQPIYKTTSTYGHFSNVAGHSPAVLAMMLGALLVGCGKNDSGTPSGESGDGKRVLTIGGHIRMYPNEEEYWQKVADDFMAENEDVEVVIKWNGSFEDVVESLQAAKMNNETIDIYSCGARYIRNSLVEARMCVDLTKLIEPYQDRWIDGALEGASIGGRVWALPMGSTGTVTFYYNMDMFEELGLEVPKTFDELVSICKVIKEKKGITPILQQGSLAGYWPMWFMETYAQATDHKSVENVSAFLNGDLKFTGEAEIKAFNMIKQFFDEGLIDTDSLNTDADGMRAAFSQGKSAMFFGGTWEYSNVMDVIGDSFKVGVFEFPEMIAGVTPQHGSGCGQSIFVPTICNPENYDLIMRFIEFFTRPENCGPIVRSASELLPSVKGVETSGDEFITYINSHHANSLVPYLDWIWPNEINDVIASNIPAVGAGYTTAEDAVKEIQNTYDRLIDEGYVYAWWDQWTEDDWKAVEPAFIPEVYGK